MNVKEWFKLKRYWLRGGLITSISMMILIIILIILDVFGYRIMNIVGKIIMLTDFNKIILKPIYFFCSGEECMGLGLLLSYPLIFVEWFLIGVLIGGWYGRIKSREIE